MHAGAAGISTSNDLFISNLPILQSFIRMVCAADGAKAPVTAGKQPTLAAIADCPWLDSR